jgi:hypothetical protein
VGLGREGERRGWHGTREDSEMPLKHQFLRYQIGEVSARDRPK